MSETAIDTTPMRTTAPVRTVDMKLEVIVIPVSDVERAKRFYDGLGWRLDGDFSKENGFRGLQFTPPGSPCSIHFGKDPSAPPGPVPIFLVVSDIEAARAELLDRGIDVSEIFHHGGPGEPFQGGRHPQRRSYASYAKFNDPDGNTWLLQEITARLPGRVARDGATFGSAAELAAAVRRAAAAHADHEKRVRKHDTVGWPDWYAEYMVREQAGKPLPE